MCLYKGKLKLETDSVKCKDFNAVKRTAEKKVTDFFNSFFCVILKLQEARVLLLKTLSV